jgi:DNA processing protein
MQLSHFDLLLLAQELRFRLSDIESLDALSEKKRVKLKKLIAAGRHNEIKQLADKSDITIIPINSDDYPPLLKTIHTPPLVLYVRGKLPNSDAVHLSVVGSRKCSSYGKRSAARLVEDIARQYAIIVSGMAQGIDTAAHAAACRAGGKSVGVLAAGLNNMSGRERDIEEHLIHHGGAILSEFAPDIEAQKFHFPIRNRIIAGMSQASLIIEATKKSGTLITAKYALEENRDVFAVPGNIDAPTSEGTNALIQNGATPITCPQDLYHALNLDAMPAPKETIKADSAEEQKLLEVLTRVPMHVDEILEKVGLPSAKMLSIISLAEIKGRIKHHGGKFYTRT